jgi:hypothetical protein
MVKIHPRRNAGIYEVLRSTVDVGTILGGQVGEKVGCVFHEEDDVPDLHIYEDHAYCFACAESGDVTKVWKAMHGFASMWEAAQDLARKYNIELPEVSPEAKARYEERRRKEDKHAKLAAERHAILKDPKSRVGRKVQEYLTGRGITDEIRDRFMLGATKGGHLNIPGWVGSQIHGQIIRRLDGREPKYKAPSAEEFALGRRPIFMVGSPKAQPYLLVEGFLDQPAAEVLGIPAIGTGAARLSKEQIADLRELGEKGATFYVLPDDDEGGSSAARTNTTRLYPYAYMTPPIPGEDIKDVSDLHKADPDNAAEILRDLMAAGQDAVEVALSVLPKRPLDKIRYLKREIVPLILQLENQSERGAVIRAVAKADGLTIDIVRDALTEVEGRLIVETHAAPTENLPEEEWEHLLEPGVLDRYISDVCKIKGVVGEPDKKVIKLLFCDALEAQLDPLPTGKPVGGPIMLTGDSGRGKNFLSDAAVCGLPEEWYLSFEAASATSFYYAAEIDPAFLKHKFIYPNEAEAIDTVVEFLRPMFSQAKAKKYVTNKNSDGAHVFQEIEVLGPITGVVPTTRNTLNRELQTRMLVCELESYETQIADHSAALSRQFSPDFVANPHGDMIPKWGAALSTLTGVRKVVIPFADHQKFRLSNEDIRHGARLWGNLLGLMCAHAWLEQRNREIQEWDGGTRAVVATAADYRAAYELLKSVGSRSIINLGETHRKIVQAIYDLKQEDKGPFSSDGYGVREIAKRAGVSPGTISKNRTFLTKSAGLAGLIYEVPETHKLAIADDADPSWWESGDIMRGFPKPSEVEGYIPSPPEGGNSGNMETPKEKLHTYAAEGVSKNGNNVETVETVFPGEKASGSAWEGPF